MPKICLVADIHHGTDTTTKKGSAAAALMSEFCDFVGTEDPDLVLDLGDRISDVDHDTDMVLEREAAAMFAPIAQPVHHICGNHDRDFLTVAENEEILSQSLANETIDLDGWTVVLFRADAKIHRNDDGTRGFAMPEADLVWLAGVVATATQPLAIFTHVPLSGHDQTGNYYFQKNPDFSRYPDTDRIRAVIESSRVPLACFSGHVHWNTLTTVHGIPYLTIQSLTETFTTHPEPAGAMATLDLGPDEIVLDVRGLDAFQARVPVAQTARRWVAALPPFSRHREIAARLAEE
ncbi:MAG: metallophosphoesterase [Pseudomonadota bacterium]